MKFGQGSLSSTSKVSNFRGGDLFSNGETASGYERHLGMRKGVTE